MLKIAPEGYLFVAVFFILTVIAVFVFGPKWAVIPLVLTLFMVYFFRDPERYPPPGTGYISPADGRVVFIEREREDQFIKDDILRISIFMSPFNVHVNRAPCDGEVLAIKHKPGSFMAAYRKEASWKNENTAMHMNCPGGDVLVRQVAGFLARRTVNRMKPGDTLKRGERFGMIKFSSRVDLYLPPGSTPSVEIGDHVKAGETVLAIPEVENTP
jgi:phosphatidylserine decarboxylase